MSGICFADMGFEGRELGVRARSCIAYLTLERRMFENDADGNLKQDLEHVCRFFTEKRRTAAGQELPCGSRHANQAE